MTSDLSRWLAAIGWTAFLWSLGGLVTVNAVAVAAWVWRKDRALVQRWVAPWLAANLVLALAGVGIPAATSAVRLVLMAVEGSAPMTLLRTVGIGAARPANPGDGSAD